MRVKVLGVTFSRRRRGPFWIHRWPLRFGPGAREWGQAVGRGSARAVDRNNVLGRPPPRPQAAAKSSLPRRQARHCGGAKRAVRAINPAGEVVETGDVWWWQSEEGRPIAEVRAVCRRNALSEVAANSEKHEVHIAALEAAAAYAWAMHESGRHVPGTQVPERIQTILNWAQIHPDSSVIAKVHLLWEQVLMHERASWERLSASLLESWADPACLRSTRLRVLSR